MARNCSETVVQLDSQEQPPIETEQRRVIVEAVRKFSSLAKSSSRAGKSFFPVLTRSPKPMLRPWPSTVSISHPVQTPSSPMPIPTSAIDGDPWRKDSYDWRNSLHRRSSVEDSEGRPSVSSQGEKNQEGVVNSVFAEEKMDNVPDICDCDNVEEGDDGSTFSPSHRCKQISCQQSSTPETIDMSMIGDEPSNSSRINSSPKYLIARRNRSTSDSRKKGIQWRSRLSGPLKPRRRTTDSIPTMGEILSQTWSSPNLKNLEELAKTVPNITVNPPYKQEEDSKL